jgi:hypothetical protein
MGLLNVPLWTTLVYLRVQVLQVEDLPTLHQQSIKASILASFTFSFPVQYVLHPKRESGQIGAITILVLFEGIVVTDDCRSLSEMLLRS